MGHSYVEIEVSSLERKKFSKLKALVDTEASLTAPPEKIAKEIGIEPVSEERVMTGAGMVKVKRERAWIKLKDREALSTYGYLAS